jgi:hypothetical protein
METVLSLLFGVFVFVAIIAFGKWHKYEKEQRLRELISWSAIGDYCPAFNRYSYVVGPLIAVLNAQHNDAIDKKYRITEEEKQYAKKIIEEYQIDIMRSYFEGNRIVIKSKYAVPEKTYFMFALYVFLCDHQSEYSIRDSAAVFHKMHYITYMYCKSSNILRDHVPNWNERNLKEILDTILDQRS